MPVFPNAEADDETLAGLFKRAVELCEGTACSAGQWTVPAIDAIRQQGSSSWGVSVTNNLVTPSLRASRRLRSAAPAPAERRNQTAAAATAQERGLPSASSEHGRQRQPGSPSRRRTRA